MKLHSMLLLLCLISLTFQRVLKIDVLVIDDRYYCIYIIYDCTVCPREVVPRGGQWAPPWVDRVYNRKSVLGFFAISQRCVLPESLDLLLP